MSSSIYIVIGLVILFFSYFLVAWAITGLHFWVSKEKAPLGRVMLISSSLASAGVFATLFSMIFASGVSIYVFGTISAVISGILYVLLLKLVWKFSNFDTSVIAITLSIMLNLGWLRLLGLL